uniref:Uncharacterized protein n=1 Tax=Cacopsylla melanoneura TaxID=428564 RepID=A0A8D8WWN2_9HEMI
MVTNFNVPSTWPRNRLDLRLLTTYLKCVCISIVHTNLLPFSDSMVILLFTFYGYSPNQIIWFSESHSMVHLLLYGLPPTNVQDVLTIWVDSPPGAPYDVEGRVSTAAPHTASWVGTHPHQTSA